ncbi:MAG: pirin family protein [Phycisphaerales bacterium]|nr:pirin family protein [Phycisphaerales bacterium]
MSISLRPASTRGTFDHGWLKTAHTFSFGDYNDPEHMGFGPLRVINDDVVAPGQGFGMHPHRDMEILTYIISGTLAHQDSLGNTEQIKAGQLQRMTAGRGIRHSEFNASRAEPVHLLQIWVIPSQRGLEPSYEDLDLGAPAAGNGSPLRLVAAPGGGDGVLTINQDAKMYLARFDACEGARLSLAPGRSAYIQAFKGAVRVGEQRLGPGDGAAITGESSVALAGEADSAAVVFDLPPWE